MGIQVEFNPDLALRNIAEHEQGRRHVEECIPQPLVKGKTYYFRKEGQRLYWLKGEIALLETKGGEQLSRPLASITIIEVMHYLKDGKLFTGGRYVVNDVFDPKDMTPRFEWMRRLS